MRVCVAKFCVSAHSIRFQCFCMYMQACICARVGIFTQSRYTQKQLLHTWYIHTYIHVNKHTCTHVIIQSRHARKLSWCTYIHTYTHPAMHIYIPSSNRAIHVNYYDVYQLLWACSCMYVCMWCVSTSVSLPMYVCDVCTYMNLRVCLQLCVCL
jgi:hypothetical protein